MANSEHHSGTRMRSLSSVWSNVSLVHLSEKISASEEALNRINHIFLHDIPIKLVKPCLKAIATWCLPGRRTPDYLSGAMISRSKISRFRDVTSAPISRYTSVKSNQCSGICSIGRNWTLKIQSNRFRDGVYVHKICVSSFVSTFVL